MLKKIEQEQPPETGWYFRKIYWFIASALFFLLVASAYVVFVPSTYKVTTRIAVANLANPRDIVKNITSKALLQKVISQLPLQLSYYHKNKFKEVELSRAELPMIFVPYNNAINSSAEIEITVLDNHQYRISTSKTSMLFFFNHPVDFYSFAKFKVVKGPGFNTDVKHVRLSIKNTENLVQEYSKNLNAKFAGNNNNSIELSLKTISLKKGKDFLNKLVEVYNKPIITAVTPAVPVAVAAPVKTRDNKPLLKLNKELAALKEKAARLQAKQATITEGFKKIADRQANRKLELTVLNTIEPYAQSPVEQSVPIPESYQVNDKGLKTLIVKYNKGELDKKHALQETRVDDAKITKLNALLLKVKKSMLDRIDSRRNELEELVLLSDAQNSHASIPEELTASILKVNGQLKEKQQEYDNLTQSTTEATTKIVEKPKQPVIEKVDEHIATYPRPGYIYLFALIMGVALPLIILAVRIRANMKKQVLQA